MIQQPFRRNGSESGQTIAMVVLILGIFMLGTFALSVDFANAYFHRQSAQDAADAACTAGIMDLLANSQGNNLGNFPAGSPPAQFKCSANATAAPCIYAARNGYSATGLVAKTPSNDVQISFPTTGILPQLPNGLAPTQYLQVDVLDRQPTWFSGLITGGGTIDVLAEAKCGLQQAKAPVPLVVLNPSCSNALDLGGSTSVTIVGGPSRSIQVNSNNQTGAITLGTIDLSHGGQNFTGSSLGVFGAPITAAGAGGTFNPGTTGSWQPGAAPIGDPYALVNAPSQPNTTPPQTGTHVGYGVHGCPDQTSGCTEYQPGKYTSAISVKNAVAIFDPGVYYITGTTKGNCPKASSCQTKATGQCRYGLYFDSNSLIRPANDPTLGYSSGAMFYLSGASGAGSYGSVYIDANSGKAPGSDVVDSFVTSNFTCPGASAPPSQLNLPTQVPGNVFLGQCTGSGTWVGATTTNGLTDTSGTVRGLIFFDDRANGDTNGQPHMQGGGGLVLSGNLYFHNCNSGGTGTNCSLPSTGYNGLFELQGTPGAGTYVLGNVTTDSFVEGGNASLNMALNPNAVYNILKASLIQ